MKDDQKRRERPVTAAQVQTETLPPENSTASPGMSDLEKAVISFAVVSQPGDVAAAFTPDGIYLLERTADGVFSELGDEDSATLLLVNGRAA